MLTVVGWGAWDDDGNLPRVLQQVRRKGAHKSMGCRVAFVGRVGMQR